MEHIKVVTIAGAIKGQLQEGLFDDGLPLGQEMEPGLVLNKKASEKNLGGFFVILAASARPARASSYQKNSTRS